MTITKTALLTNRQSSTNMKETGENKMNTVKWDDKFFRESISYIWIYSKGLLVSTNNRKSRSFILKGFRRNKIKSLNNIPPVKLEKKNNK